MYETIFYKKFQIARNYTSSEDPVLIITTQLPFIPRTDVYIHPTGTKAELYLKGAEIHYEGETGRVTVYLEAFKSWHECTPSELLDQTIASHLRLGWRIYYEGVLKNDMTWPERYANIVKGVQKGG